MTNSRQAALIKKDLRYITSNSRLFVPLLVVPLVFTIILPTIFVLTTAYAPAEMEDFKSMLELLPGNLQTGDFRQVLLQLIFNNIMPVFFLLIPIMAATVMAAGSFVGEKEKSTLETLLYSPLTLRQIFNAKILSAFIMSMLVSVSSFLVMILVLETELQLIMGFMILPNSNWLVMMLLVSPAVSLLSITLIVRGSAKAMTSEESQQRSVFLILPIIFLAAGQFSGLMLLDVWMFLGLGILLATLALLAMRGSVKKFTYETLLR